MSKKPGWWLALAGAATFALAILPFTARADVVPGDRITEQNIDKVKDLISPGMEWCIKHGWPMTIGETKRVEWPKAYKEATEKIGRASCRESGEIEEEENALTRENTQ